MDILRALEIVIELAQQNIAPDEVDMEEQRRIQLDAINTVEDMIVNQFGEG